MKRKGLILGNCNAGNPCTVATRAIYLGITQKLKNQQDALALLLKSIVWYLATEQNDTIANTGKIMK